MIEFISYGQYRDKELPDTDEIYALYISKEYYGKSIGKQLMPEALRKFQSYSQVALWMFKDNERAINLYKKAVINPTIMKKYTIRFSCDRMPNAFKATFFFKR